MVAVQDKEHGMKKNKPINNFNINNFCNRVFKSREESRADYFLEK